MDHEIIERLARMEARLCQVMLHLGLDPQERKYNTPRAVMESISPIGPKVWRQRQ